MHILTYPTIMLRQHIQSPWEYNLYQINNFWYQSKYFPRCRQKWAPNEWFGGRLVGRAGGSDIISLAPLCCEAGKRTKFRNNQVNGLASIPSLLPCSRTRSVFADLDMMRIWRYSISLITSSCVLMSSWRLRISSFTSRLGSARKDPSIISSTSSPTKTYKVTLKALNYSFL